MPPPRRGRAGAGAPRRGLPRSSGHRFLLSTAVTAAAPLDSRGIAGNPDRLILSAAHPGPSGMADRDRQSVGGMVVGGRLRKVEKGADHPLHLSLAGGA